MNGAERFFKAVGKGDEATALHCLKGNPSLARAIGAARSPVFNKQASALIMAAELGWEGMVTALLQAGSEVTARGALGGMALHWASWQGHPDIVRHLVAAGSPLEATDTRFACTPFFWAVHGFSYHGDAIRRDQLGAARALLQAGANPDVKNAEGILAVELLTDPADAPMLDLIRKAGE